MDEHRKKEKPVIGISCGDLNGIGMEVIIKTFSDARMFDFCTPVVFASSRVASYHLKALDAKDFNFHIIPSADKIRDNKPNLVNCWKEEVPLEYGKESPEVGSYAIRSLDEACSALEKGQIDALVTAPLHKHAVQSADFRFPGHTEYLGERFGGTPLMLMVAEDLRIAVATGHIPLSEVPEHLNIDNLKEKITLLGEALIRDFGKRKPRIAVLAINPHAGDSGVIGSEDDDITRPAVEAAFESGILAFGPYPADSFFGSGQHEKFDGILAMYHDQGLVAFKTLSFGRGVNYTAGLPVIRTSPDHGTAFEIAGRNEADESSFRQAVYTACEVYGHRETYGEIAKDPLRPQAGGRKKERD